ncbi:uncharacterized protein LODBEIA_P34770 [Lodderomyces beijingensis]|uniref:Magnesium transporter protein 1 n=1 Tax=Lodderomyces beijingensis TaxID=1775926 RepID=A0ABP0ZM60_9ASCO
MLLVQLVVLYVLTTILQLCKALSTAELTQLARDSQAVTPELGYQIAITQSDLSILDGVRDYYTLITLTSTNPKHNCELCKQLQPIVARVSELWHRDYSSTNFLHFLTIDMSDMTNQDVFRQLRLTSIPHVWMIPPAHLDLPLDLSQLKYEEWRIPKSDQIMSLAQFVGEHTQRTIVVSDDDALAKFVKTFVLVLGSIILIRKRGPQFTTKKTILCFASIAFILLCLGGYQFTLQNRVPFIAKNDEGAIILISGGTHYQFASEIVLVALNYGALSLVFITLMNLGKGMWLGNNEKLRIWLIVVACLLVYLLVSCLTSMILRKDGGYPYGFNRLF